MDNEAFQNQCDQIVTIFRHLRMYFKCCISCPPTPPVQTVQIDGELALYDVIDNICKYLPRKDLLNVAKVCESWCIASLREERKRYHIQQLFLKFSSTYWPDTALMLPYNFNHLSSVVRAEPYLSLFVSRNRWCGCYTSERILLLELKKQLPNIVMLMIVNSHNLTEDSRNASVKGKYFIRFGGADILGILFPSGKPQIRTNVASIEYDSLNVGAINNALLAKNLAEDLRLNECEYSKSTVLLLKWHFHHDSTDNSIIREFHKIIQQSGKEVTLANIHSINVAYTLKLESDHECVRKPYVALRISGRTVESWSTFIHHRAQSYDINCKLQELKEKVNKSKRYYIGLVSTPTCGELSTQCSHSEHPCGDNYVMMRSLKGVFPYIHFTGFYVYRSELYTNPPVHHSFPDVFNENGAYNPDFLDQMDLYITIIIISYD